MLETELIQLPRMLNIQPYYTVTAPWIKIFKGNTSENINFLCVVAVGIALYLALEGDSHTPCMTECKQNVVCLLSRLLATVACFWELPWSWKSYWLIQGSWQVTDKQLNLSFNIKLQGKQIFNSKLWQSQNINLINVLHIMWVLALYFPCEFSANFMT